MKKTSTLIKTLSFTLILIDFSFAQNKNPSRNITIKFQPIFNEEILELGKSYLSKKNDLKIKIETLNFYISKIELFNSGINVFREKESYHLIKMNERNRLNLELSTDSEIRFDEIRFIIGVDSETNNKGIGNGDLDPTMGMYWTWQSGYINIKMEGEINPVDSIKKRFEFHLGGFLEPFQSSKQVRFSSSEKNLIFEFNVESFFSNMNLDDQKDLKIMSPSEKSVKLSNLFSNCISLKNDEN